MNRDTLRENVDDNYMASYIANDAEHVCGCYYYDSNTIT